MKPEAISAPPRTRSTFTPESRATSRPRPTNRAPPGRRIFEKIPEDDCQDERVPEQHRHAESLVPNTTATSDDSDCPNTTAEFEIQRMTPLTK